MDEGKKAKLDERMVVLPEYLIEVLKEKLPERTDISIENDTASDVCLKFLDKEVHLENMYCIQFDGDNVICVKIGNRKEKVKIGELSMSSLLDKLAKTIMEI